MPDPTLSKEYQRLRRAGWRACNALEYAQTELAWAELESLSDWDDGIVRLKIEPDDSLPVWLDFMPKEIERAGRDGVWGIVGQYRDPTCGKWITVDAAWGFVGADWRNSGYDYDVKRATLDAWARAYKPLARALVAKGVGL